MTKIDKKSQKTSDFQLRQNDKIIDEKIHPKPIQKTPVKIRGDSSSSSLLNSTSNPVSNPPPTPTVVKHRHPIFKGDCLFVTTNLMSMEFSANNAIAQYQKGSFTIHFTTGNSREFQRLTPKLYKKLSQLKSKAEKLCRAGRMLPGAFQTLEERWAIIQEFVHKADKAASQRKKTALQRKKAASQKDNL